MADEISITKPSSGFSVTLRPGRYLNTITGESFTVPEDPKPDTDPTKLIERLCRKCADVATVNYTKGYDTGGPPTVYIGPEIEWHNWEFVIRLVIAAMREPTAAMVSGTDYPNTTWDSGCEDVWRAMIDGLLKE